jgi:hypothetical protein
VKLSRLTNLFSSRRHNVPAEADLECAPDVEAIVDQVLDREASWSRELDQLLKRDRAAADRLRRTQEILDRLRTPVRGPDLSASILAEVGARRGWLTTGWMRFVTAGRAAAAACVVLAVGGVYVAERMSGGRIDLAGRPTPLTDFVSQSSSDVSGGVRQLVTAVAGVVQQPCGGQSRRDVCVPEEWPKVVHCQTLQGSVIPRQAVSLHDACPKSRVVAARAVFWAADSADRPVLLTPVVAFEARREAPDQILFVRSPQAETAALFGVPPR